MWRLFERDDNNVWTVRTADGLIVPATEEHLIDHLELWLKHDNKAVFRQPFELATELGPMDVKLYVTFLDGVIDNVKVTDPNLGIALMENIKRFCIEEDE